MDAASLRLSATIQSEPPGGVVLGLGRSSGAATRIAPHELDVAGKRMHQTTVRFGSDFWQMLEAEAAAQRVSVAQFVREPALARVVYLSGRRGDADYERALEASGAPVAAAAETAPERRAEEVADASAPWAQSRQTRHERLRERS